MSLETTSVLLFSHFFKYQKTFTNKKIPFAYIQIAKNHVHTSKINISILSKLLTQISIMLNKKKI